MKGELCQVRESHLCNGWNELITPYTILSKKSNWVQTPYIIGHQKGGEEKLEEGVYTSIFIEAELAKKNNNLLKFLVKERPSIFV